ncbi:MAG TPA: transposase [Ktedonobacteraceae bacterium]|nr:transposase [Ktedonobacteraceae bacterium]
MFYTGIDWADEKHDAVLVDDTGRRRGSIQVTHTPEGLAKLDEWLRQMLGHESQEQMACIIETTHGLLITFLLPLYAGYTDAY